MEIRTIKGDRVPALGLGTLNLKGEDGVEAMRAALGIGYRHLDTAQFYGNEAEVGEAIVRSSVARAETFVTTKIWWADLAPAGIAGHVEQSLERLRTDYVDLLLVHWPNPAYPIPEVLEAFFAVQKAGKARHIGVSNFPVRLLREAIAHCGDRLFCDQVEYHPFLDQRPLLDELRRHGMMLTAYIPFARGEVAKDETLQAIGAERGLTAEQIALRWLIQQEGVAAIPRSSRPEHLRANFAANDFVLTEAEMARIGALRGGRRLINPAWAPNWDDA